MQQKLLLLNIRDINYANVSGYIVQQGLKKNKHKTNKQNKKGLVKPSGCQTGFLI